MNWKKILGIKQKHEHNYSGETFWRGGVRFIKCNHEGCNMCDILEDPEMEASDKRWNELIQTHKDNMKKIGITSKV